MVWVELPQTTDGLVGLIEAASAEAAGSALDAAKQAQRSQYSPAQNMPEPLFLLRWRGCQCGAAPASLQ